MLINFTNHPSSKWDEKQKSTALSLFSEILDIPFPNVSPKATQEDIDILAKEYLNKICSIKVETPITVHIMGELNLCFNLINKLKKLGIPCVASTTERNTQDMEDGSKIVKFDFVQFRSYC